MAEELDRVFAGVAMGSQKGQSQHLIDRITFFFFIGRQEMQKFLYLIMAAMLALPAAMPAFACCATTS